MNVETITMRPGEARSFLARYRKTRVAETDREVKAAIAGYRALERGKKLVDLGGVFARCPFDDRGLPRLAVARADLPRIRFWWEYGSDPVGKFSENRGWRGWAHPTHFGRRPASKAIGWSGGVETRVPLIPPDLRPAPSTVREHIVLWEVEDWAEIPRDPFLLRHLTGSLYVVVAAWNLTPLERAIVRGR